jgi:hypothetical protein
VGAFFFNSGVVLINAQSSLADEIALLASERVALIAQTIMV